MGWTDTLSSILLEAQDRGFRIAVFAEGKDSLDSAISALSTFLKVKGGSSVAYAFHPWVEGSKDRLQRFREVAPDMEDIDYSSSEKYLGATYDVVLMDLVDDFKPSHVTRLADLVRGGGLVVMYTDSLTNSKLFRNTLYRRGVPYTYYESRFLRKLGEHPSVFHIVDGALISFKKFEGETRKAERRIPNRPIVDRRIHEICASGDQNRFLERAISVLRSGKRVFVATAPRGRGKSAVAGLFLAHLALTRPKRTRVVVTSPSPLSSSAVLAFLSRGLEAVGLEHSVERDKQGVPVVVRSGDFVAEWEPPETALSDEGYMVVVDEASALGLYNVDSLVRRWDRSILLTTVHGYEGSGKTFLKYLDSLLKGRHALTASWMTMTQPLRYALGDPVEKWIYDAFLLDEGTGVQPEDVVGDMGVMYFQEEDKGVLFADDMRLSSVYSVLSTAHYRNNPDDLMVMGNAPHHRIFTISLQDRIVGVAQVADEGGLTGEETESLLSGVTYEGDLIPDRLVKHTRVREFGKMRGWRVVRIAVIPGLQDMGLGTVLLRKVWESLPQDYDYLGSSFMMDERVLSFWVRNGFTPVHLSPRRNEELNSYSVIVMRPSSQMGERSVRLASSLLKEKVLGSLHDVYFDMSPSAASKVISSIRVHKDVVLDRLTEARLKAFLRGLVPYEAVPDAVRSIFLKYLWDGERDWSLPHQAEAGLVAKLIQGKPWGKAALSVGTRRVDLEGDLYSAVSQLYSRYLNSERDWISLDDLNEEVEPRKDKEGGPEVPRPRGTDELP